MTASIEAATAFIFGDFLLPTLFLFGLIVGSFLNVVIYRLHTNKTLSGNSHCLSCGTRLSWYELFPLFSYLFLRGACKHCGAYIPPRYFLVELLTGVLFVVMGTASGSLFELGLNLVIISLVVIVLVYDVRHTIIPDEMVILLSVCAVLMASWSPDASQFVIPPLFAVLGGVVAAAFYAFLWFISKGRWIGLGDAKLAFPFGILVGLPLVFSLIVWSFWIGAIVSVALLLARTYLIKLRSTRMGGKTFLRFRLPHLTMKSEIPFAPFLIAALLCTYVYSISVFDITAALLRPFGL